MAKEILIIVSKSGKVSYDAPGIGDPKQEKKYVAALETALNTLKNTPEEGKERYGNEILIRKKKK